MYNYIYCLKIVNIFNFQWYIHVQFGEAVHMTYLEILNFGYLYAYEEHDS